MEMKNDPKKFINQVEELYQVALLKPRAIQSSSVSLQRT